MPASAWEWNSAIEITGSNIIVEGEGAASIIQVDPETPWSTAGVGSLQTGDIIAIGLNDPPTVTPTDNFYVQKMSDTTIKIFTTPSFSVEVTRDLTNILIYYRLDSVLSIVGNELVNPRIGPVTQNGIEVPSSAGAFNQTIISKNVISAFTNHISLCKPMAGTSGVIVSENIFTDSLNKAVAGTVVNAANSGGALGQNVGSSTKITLNVLT